MNPHELSMSVKEEKGYRRVDLENGDNYEGGFATVSPRRERMIGVEHGSHRCSKWV